MPILNQTLGLAVRAFLVMFFAGLLIAQVMSVPGTFAHMASENPDLAYLRWPLTAFGIVELACLQVVVVCTWRLLSMVSADAIFTEAAFGWVDAIVWAIGTAWVLLLGVFVYYTVVEADDPGLPVLMIGLLLSGGTVGLLVVVLRELLRRATELRTDLQGVI